MTRINGTVHCTDDVTSLDAKSILITRERAIGRCILRALTTSDEAVVGDDNSIRRTNLGLLVLGRPWGVMYNVIYACVTFVDFVFFGNMGSAQFSCISASFQTEPHP